MKKLIAASLSTALLFTSSWALAEGTAGFVPPAPDIAGKAYIVNDFYSGQTLASRDPNTRIEPASLTKLMTAYLTFKAIKEGRLKGEQMLQPSEKAWRTEGSRMFLDLRTPVSVNDLMRGMIVQSGNDACVTLAEAIGGSEEVFAQMMNREAKRLGMTGSNFTNSTGLPDPNLYMTVRDLGILSGALIHDYPEFYPIYSMKEFTYNKIKQPNRNLLLYRDPSVDGLKTGHTASAGFNLVSSAKRDDRRVISVVVGTTSPEARAVESSKLLNYGLQFFDTPRLYQANQSVSTLRVYKGDANDVNVGFADDVYVTVPKGAASRIKVSMTSTQPLIAPVKQGQAVGKLTLTLDGKVITERPVVALKTVDEGGFFSRLIDTIKLWFA
ncbi:D-alanyl-D-alanine carboxypeptidase [Laribacter hongkongensis]|uniref:serine-type D-Ala-D-Ala carboxypeptidase n=2 Tax=Laribacter hongkongensis TaxID=168471 RepID=C1D5T6_LARHH|nr:D-alanyl-D-alanine carboxypeptidase family protein [Laribacter hongkongensis]MBP8814567.1 D-alanyl-D-alanine carboxypeptidase [Laribacter sp.]ACO73967.1 DacC [Laribacter hongkongensis HLHK9]ASJ23925.1 cytochrome c550 [Laribacter hongkongensis]MBE5529323.1 peptidase [Laribacter hongkongensis]MBP9528506.1 D-alanyl-D-alanine carboxypeptidase [Laribacter sp.]